MFRRFPLLRCTGAAASKSSSPQFHHNTDPIHVAAGATPSKYDFAARYEELRADKSKSGNALASEPYEALMSNLKDYDDLLRTYSVKQTEIERARKAARMCGLEWTKKRERGE